MTYVSSTHNRGTAERRFTKHVTFNAMAEFAARLFRLKPSNDQEYDPMKVAVIERLTGQKLPPRPQQPGSGLTTVLLVAIAGLVLL